MDLPSPPRASADLGRVAFAIALALLIVTALPLLPAFVVSLEGLDSGALSFVPACPSRLAGVRCGLCGLSHAFAAMADGRVELAAEYNPDGPWLFTVCVVVALASLATLVVLALKRRRGAQFANTSVQ